MAEDGSVIVVGRTYGSWDGKADGAGGDVAAFRLDGDGEEIWRYQVGCSQGLVSFPLRPHRCDVEKHGESLTSVCAKRFVVYFLEMGFLGGKWFVNAGKSTRQHMLSATTLHGEFLRSPPSHACLSFSSYCRHLE